MKTGLKTEFFLVFGVPPYHPRLFASFAQAELCTSKGLHHEHICSSRLLEGISLEILGLREFRHSKKLLYSFCQRHQVLRDGLWTRRPECSPGLSSLNRTYLLGGGGPYLLFSLLTYNTYTYITNIRTIH